MRFTTCLIGSWLVFQAIFPTAVSCGGDWPDFAGHSATAMPPRTTRAGRAAAALERKGKCEVEDGDSVFGLVDARGGGRTGLADYGHRGRQRFLRHSPGRRTGKVQFKGHLFMLTIRNRWGRAELLCFAFARAGLFSRGGMGLRPFWQLRNRPVGHGHLSNDLAANDLPCRHYRGPGSSPIMFQDLLILSMDGVDVQYLVALDKKTGRFSGKRIARQTGRLSPTASRPCKEIGARRSAHRSSSMCRASRQ